MEREQTTRRLISASSTISKEQLIDQYTAAGYTLIPLKGKRPLSDDWTNTPYDPLLGPEDLPANYGVVLQNDDLIIDVDPRNFDGDDNPVVRLFEDIGLPLKPDTFAVTTGGGGLHFYFKKPPEIQIRMTVKKYKGIEFKTRGHQVVGPGSVHPETKRPYTVLNHNPSLVQNAPASIFEYIERDDTFTDDGLSNYSDDEGAIKRYCDFLKTTEPAIQNERGDETTFKVACVGKEYGLSAEKTFELMAIHYNERCTPPWPMDDLRIKVKNAYNHGKNAVGAKHPANDFKNYELPEDDVTAQELAMVKWDMIAKTNIPKPTLSNTVNYFLIGPSKQKPVKPLHKLIRYNQFSGDIEFNPDKTVPWHQHGEVRTKLWTDNDAVYLKHYLSHVEHFTTSTMLCHEAAIVVSKLNSYHPVREYLESLEWDGKPRIDRFLIDYAGADDNLYVQAVGKNMLIAAVARIFKPGCQFDHVPILEGKQGTGKSSLCRVLGGEFYAEPTIDTHNPKDTVDAMRGKWIIEASEMECTRRSDLQSLKAFLTRLSDRVRLSYARTTLDFPRQSIFIGTINPEGGYLKDGTGNRRFWPVETRIIRIDELVKDRDQLWAEAHQRFKAKELYHLADKRLIQLAEVEQAARVDEDPWETVVAQWAESMRVRGLLPEKVTSTMVAQDALNLSAKQIDRNTMIRVSKIMVNLGWEKGKHWFPELNRVANGFRRLDFDVLEGL